MIKSGILKPGDQLPPERELAARMGVGRPAVREALRALQMLRMVEIRHGDGTYVSSLDPGSLAEPYEVLLSIGTMSLDHLFEARRVFEVGIAVLAARRIDQEGIDRLRRCVAEARSVKDDPARFLELDMELHSIIVEATGNPVLKIIMSSLTGLLKASRELTVIVPGVREQVVADHEQIVEAIAARDAERSGRSVGEHLDHVWSALRAVSGKVTGGGV